MPASSAVAYLRRRTLWRAARGYLDWVGRAVGWASVVYLIAWFVIFLVSGVQLLEPLGTPLSAPFLPLAANALLGIFLLSPFLRPHVPPVTLSRADLYRLALAPALPWASLRWAFTLGGLLYASAGLILGASWSLLAFTYFAENAPLAAPALALLAPARLGLAWLAYAAEAPGRRAALVLFTLVSCALGAALPGWGLAAALYHPSPLTLLQPAVLLALTLWAVRASSRAAYPPAFPAQCLVLSELRAMSTLAFLGAGATDPARRGELLAQLRDKPPRGARWRLPAPPASWGAAGAYGWRTALHLLRRPLLSHVFLGALIMASSFGVLSPAVGFIGILFAALLLGQTLLRLVGPAAPALPLPTTPADEALGRALPGGLAAGLVVAVTLAVTLLVAAALGVTLTGGAFVIAATQPLLGALLLVKLSSLTGLPHERFEAWFVAALLALTPGLLLAPLGVGLAVFVQLGLLWGLIVLPF